MILQLMRKLPKSLNAGTVMLIENIVIKPHFPATGENCILGGVRVKYAYSHTHKTIQAEQREILAN